MIKPTRVNPHARNLVQSISKCLHIYQQHGMGLYPTEDSILDFPDNINKIINFVL